MHIIKQCPSCKAKLRFPIDSGIIKVRCKCGYSFIANPDDTALYIGAVFDLQYNQKSAQKLSYTKIVEKIITQLYSYWYFILNFKLLPTRQKIILIVCAVLVSVFIAALLVHIFYTPSQPLNNGITI